MAASSTDFFSHVGSPGTATTLAAPGHTIGGTSLTVGSTTNWSTDTGIIFAVDTYTLVNGVAVRNVGSYTEWEGVVSSGTTITSLVLRYGTDQNYPAGSTTRVYIPVASSRENRLVDGLLNFVDQDATLKAGAVDNAAVLASNVVTAAKILDANVTTSKLADANVTLAKLASTIFSGAVQTQGNSGTAGGTLYYLNLGGVKLCWGQTANQTIGGSAPQTASLTVVPPTSFFSTVQTAITNGGPPGSNSQFYWTNFSIISTSTLTLNFNQTVGAAVGFNAQFLIIGT